MTKNRLLLLVLALNTVLFTNPASSADGKSVFESNCAQCHEPAINGAPDFTDKTEWKERLQKGEKNLVDTVINGIEGYGGKMPPRGGNPKLTDEDLRSAVNYMIIRINNAK